MMSTTGRKRNAPSKTAPRADQLRPLNLPQPISVELDDGGLPSSIAKYCGPPGRLAGTKEDRQNEEKSNGAMYGEPFGRPVESIIEVWHVDDEWWREPISRRYVEVVLEGGKHVVLYEDLTTHRWYMQKP